ncbi:MAG: NAD-dependent DNA ligase LigA [Clostridia bacterium]|jgi:DNA ligase (NAD+)|nr:NAD-dependent DNA ligase LigA [Clostridia bacterium]MCI2000199.1 NAD-dependent DNA ligase LigA [Clostridia bacterium]MCI2014636.1 NAD-dependent DNA ligase LigA [Clostridia bacterium]
MDRMKQLISLLNEASKRYYMDADPIMTDFEYDKLYDELVELEKSTGIILSSSPTQNVGYKIVSSLKKVKHDKRMLSLDKTKDVTKLKSWLGKYKGMLSWKMDGLTIVLKYNEGKLVQAVTRGNGDIGEDITHNARVFGNVPLSISFKGELVLRGEGVISYSEFARINDNLPDDEKYKNPRNLTSGTVRQLNSKLVSDRKVSLYVFTLVSAEGIEFNKKSEQLDYLSSLGFEVVEHVPADENNLEQTVKEFENRICDNDFPSDGLVLTIDSIDISRSLGETAKFPKDSIAFKWKDEAAETKLLYIDWSTSRTGLINPVAVFEPVELEGTTVNRASVHNVSILQELKLGIGDTIRVYKANMIIPQIQENITKSGNVEIPRVCPVCGGETEIRQLRDGRALYCTNPNCSAQRLRSLDHFVSRDAMNIEGLSEETLRKFIENGFIDNYTDIFELKKYEVEIKKLDGFGEKSYSNIEKSIEKSRVCALPNFLYALGINNVGLSNAKLLCKYYDNDIDAIMNAKEEELAEIYGFGTVIAHSIHIYFTNDKNRKLVEKALKHITFSNPEPTDENGILKGMTFVITGDLEKYKNRKEMQKEIESKGGKVTGSVTKNTTYLINNDSLSASTKNKKASELGIPVITEDEYINMFK